MTIELFIAAFGFLACLALLVHHGLGARRQARLRHWWLLQVSGVRQRWSQMRRRQSVPQRRARHDEADTKVDTKAQAEREAADLIERARRGKDGDDKVVRPRFGGGRRKDLH